MVVKSITLGKYSLLGPFKHGLNLKARTWKPDKPIRIVGWEGSLSAFWLLHAQAWLTIGNPHEQTEVVQEKWNLPNTFGYLNGGSAGVGNKAVMLPEDRWIDVPMGADGKPFEIHLSLWAHNMWITSLDLHVNYTIFYVEV